MYGVAKFRGMNQLNDFSFDLPNTSRLLEAATKLAYHNKRKDRQMKRVLTEKFMTDDIVMLRGRDPSKFDCEKLFSEGKPNC
jgi:hypothetical protein